MHELSYISKVFAFRNTQSRRRKFLTLVEGTGSLVIVSSRTNNRNEQSFDGKIQEITR